MNGLPSVTVADLQPDDLVVFHTTDLVGVKKIIEMTPISKGRVRLKLQHMMKSLRKRQGCLFSFTVNGTDNVERVG